MPIGFVFAGSPPAAQRAKLKAQVIDLAAALAGQVRLQPELSQNPLQLLRSFRAERKSRSRETALSKTGSVDSCLLLLPHNAASAPWSSTPSLHRSISLAEGPLPSCYIRVCLPVWTKLGLASSRLQVLGKLIPFAFDY
jgi:hypothetical protein